MKIALCTTTIHPPHALKLQRKHSADVRFFVALDQKGPDLASMLEIENCAWLTPLCQMGWKCAHALPWNSLSRRNIAFLEALKWGAEAIVSWDCDNLPIDELYFNEFMAALYAPWNGLAVGSAAKMFTTAGGAVSSHAWFDPGNLLMPPTPHRGFPYRIKSKPIYGHAEDVKVGVAAGLVLGDPDIDATTRMVNAPDIKQASELGHAGVVVDLLKQWTVFNTQNTAVIAPLVPAWFLMPEVGRMDDIYASLIVQRSAREYGYQ